MGAPRKHPQKNAAEVIEELASQGNSIIGIAKKLGVGRELFKRWCEEDDTLQEAFEVGRDTHRQALVALIMRDAVAGKNANGNSMFLLKTMHGYREQDSASTKVNVGVGVAPSVMYVINHGDDEAWEARMAAQQRELILDAGSPKQIEAEASAPAAFAPPAASAPSWGAYEPSTVVQSHPASPPPPPQHSGDIPAWRGNA